MRIVNDNPQNNMEQVLNMVIVKDGEVWIRGGKNEEDCTLVEYIQHLLQLDDEAIASSNVGEIGVEEAKLLCLGVSAFTEKNAQNSGEPILQIYADMKEYARANGIKIDPSRMATQEEQEKENRRAAKALENFVAKVSRNAKTLKSNASFSWKEKIKGKAKSYNGVSLIGAYKIDSSVIMLEFTQSAAERMMKSREITEA